MASVASAPAGWPRAASGAVAARADTRPFAAVRPADADLLLGLFLGGNVLISGDAETGTAIGALAGASLKARRAMQTMPVGTEELEIGFCGRRASGVEGRFPGDARIGEIGLRDVRVGIARFREVLLGGVGHAESHPAAGALRRLARLGRLTTNFVPVGAEKLDHRGIPTRSYLTVTGRDKPFVEKSRP